MRITITFLFFLSVNGLLSGQVVINGHVRDKDSGQAVEGVNVLLQNLDGTEILKFSTSGKEGDYRLSCPERRDSLLVCVTGFNIQSQSKRIAPRTQTVDFQVEYEAMHIREVIVKAREIVRSSDTLIYSVAGFIDQSDRSIGDVLKKMPGIEVKSSGEISYQGKAINKFYIESMDMLQGRYGIATNNVQAKDVASVEVYENHQPIRALKEIQDSDAAALNLRLKESAKGVFNATFQAGIGYKPFMWNAEVVPMYFARLFQTMSTYKTNNTGEDVSAELRDHYAASGGEGSMLRIVSPSSPPLDRQRYLDNNIHTVSANVLTKLAEETTLTVNGSYLHDEQAALGSSAATYFFPDLPSVLITEVIDNSLRRDRTSAGVQVEANKDKFFLKEKVSFSGQWDKNRGHVFTGGQDEVFQKLSDRIVSLNNDFSILKVIGFNRINFSSKTSYQEKPSELFVTPLLYPDIVEGGVSDYAALAQKVNIKRLDSRNSAFWGRKFGRFFPALNVAVNLNSSDTESRLSALRTDGEKTAVPDDRRNDMTYRRMDFRVGPSLRYEGNYFNIDLSVPLDYMLLDISDRVSGGIEHHKNKLLWTPAMSFLATLHHNLKLDAKASLYTSYGGTDIYSGLIMTDYRTIGTREGGLRESRMQNYSLSLNYGNALLSLFGSLDGRYWRTKSNLMYNTVFSGTLSRIESVPIDNTSEGYMLGGKISKRFSSIATTLNLSGQYILSYADVLRQDEVMNARSDQYNAGFSTVTLFRRTTRLDYDLSWRRSRTSIRGGASYEPIDVVRQEAAFTFFAGKRVNIRVSGEHFHNSAVTGDKNMFFTDASVSYKTKRVEYRLEARNLMGTDRYDSASYGDLMSYVYSYRLRPRSVMLKVRFSLK